MGKIANHELREWMIKFNDEQSKKFCEPGNRLERDLYWKQHPTHIIALKCMDGRLNLPYITKTPVGIVQPYRNIGGRFDLGWPYFGMLMVNEAEYAVNHGRRCLAIVTYHFSKGDEHRGCAGFHYDTAAAKAAAMRLRDQLLLNFVGDAKTRVFYPIVVGVETDEDALVFHADGSDALLDMADTTLSGSELMAELGRLYPNMDGQMLADLLPLAAGNLEHIAELRAKGRNDSDLDHGEQIIMFGRGFDWFHEINRAFIVGPYGTEDEQRSIVTAGTVTLRNLRAGVIPEDQGVLLFTTGLYRQQGAERGAAREKAQYLARSAHRILEQEVPDIIPYLDVLVGVVSAETRKLEVLETPDFELQ